MRRSNPLVMREIQPIHDRLRRVNAQLFAIGIGAGHNKKNASRKLLLKEVRFTGTYIDTTTGKESIESAIAKTYEQALATFSEPYFIDDTARGRCLVCGWSV